MFVDHMQALLYRPPCRDLVIENSHTQFTDEGTMAGLEKPWDLPTVTQPISGRSRI